MQKARILQSASSQVSEGEASAALRRRYLGTAGRLEPTAIQVRITHKFDVTLITSRQVIFTVKRISSRIA